MRSLIELTQKVNDSTAVENNFFRKWQGGQMSIDHIAIFARNYWEWTFCFPEALAGLISNTKDVNARVEYVKILYSELGCGKMERAHSTLFEEFCNKLSMVMGKPGYLEVERLQVEIPLLQATAELNLWQKTMYANKNIAIGAQLALEWQAYTMIRKLYEGARNYMSLWHNQDDFHDACEFFYVHIGEAEKDHKQEAIGAAEQLINTGVSFDDVKTGFCKNLELIGKFWNSIADACC